MSKKYIGNEHTFIREGSEPLGSGGQGDVYLAYYQNDSSKKVAIKNCKSQSKKSKERFKREIDSLNKLNKDLIDGMVQIIDYSHSEGWYAMPLLNQKINLASSKMTIEDKVKYLLQLANIISKLHEKGYIHRDIKLKNILFKDNKLYLCDYGLVYNNIFDSITTFNERVGPNSFIAPEMTVGVNERLNQFPADVFSFAQVVYCTFKNKAFGIGRPIENLRIPYLDSKYLLEPIYELIELGTKNNPEDRIDINGCIERLEEFFKIINGDNRAKVEWEKKEIRNNLLRDKNEDSKIYTNAQKILVFLNQLNRNFKIEVSSNQSIEYSQSKIFHEGFIFYDKQTNYEYLMFIKKLEITKNEEYYLEIERKNEDLKYQEYQENKGVLGMLQKKSKFVINKNLNLRFIEK